MAMGIYHEPGVVFSCVYKPHSLLASVVKSAFRKGKKVMLAVQKSFEVSTSNKLLVPTLGKMGIFYNYQHNRLPQSSLAYQFMTRDQ